ncbi:MAG: hypothetical protein WCF67_21240 [Chitinophagaceae bacterium]
MCRYAMSYYKPHYACFECRKTFKRRLMWDIRRDHDSVAEAKCPQCASLMANMGKDFEAPKMDDLKAWQHIKTLYSVGISFHSCGCTGPGYIPNTKDKLIDYLEEQKQAALHNLEFWRNRIEPTDSRELNRDLSKNWNFITKIPGTLVNKKTEVRNEDAIHFWIGRLKEIELRIIKVP